MNSGSPLVSIIIPTLRRPESLARAVRSVFAQDGISEFAPLQLILADNDPDGSALAKFAMLEAEAPSHFVVRSIHVPEPGVANVRNAALDVAEGRYIVFLDDDQSAHPGWLSAMIRGQQALGTAVSFGPIDTGLPDTVTDHIRYFTNFFDRLGPTRTGEIDYYYGCGNAVLDTTQLPQKRPVFDPRANETGGEDDELFSRIEHKGGRFGWIVEARVVEHVPASRARLAYTLRRAFAYGQGPSFSAWRDGPAGWYRIPFHMTFGVFQALGCGVAAGLTWIARHDSRAWWLDKAARGLGKTFWWSAFKQNLYGRAALKPVRSEPLAAPVEPDRAR